MGSDCGLAWGWVAMSRHEMRGIQMSQWLHEGYMRRALTHTRKSLVAKTHHKRTVIVCVKYNRSPSVHADQTLDSLLHPGLFHTVLSSRGWGYSAMCRLSLPPECVWSCVPTGSYVLGDEGHRIMLSLESQFCTDDPVKNQRHITSGWSPPMARHAYPSFPNQEYRVCSDTNCDKSWSVGSRESVKIAVWLILHWVTAYIQTEDRENRSGMGRAVCPCCQHCYPFGLTS